MNFKKGDKVICIRERDVPKFIGTIWIVDFLDSKTNLIYCKNTKLYKTKEDECFPFRKTEIAIFTPLMKELL